MLASSPSGSISSTPALGIIQQAAKSTVPALGYAGTYVLANVLLTKYGMNHGEHIGPCIQQGLSIVDGNAADRRNRY